MKKRLSPFVAGMATMALLGSLGVSALAATGAFSITVNPINIQVNGETFAPKDATGADVPVFSYNGTTYAPLRALAEAYGLDVGYDAGANMATVGAKAAVETSAIEAPALSDEPWTLIADKEYSDGVIFIVYATYFRCDALLNACQGDEQKAKLEAIISRSETVAYRGNAYISLHSVDAFLDESGAEIQIDHDNQTTYIRFPA